MERAEAVEAHLAGADGPQVHFAFVFDEKTLLLPLANHLRREAALGAGRDHCDVTRAISKSFVLQVGQW